MPRALDAHTGGSAVGSVLVDGHLVHLPGIEGPLMEILIAEPGRVVALDAVVAGLGIGTARAIRVVRRLRRRLLVSPLSPPLIEIMPRAGVRYMITPDTSEE
jgi:DNA-binding response OmpR family regulator